MQVRTMALAALALLGGCTTHLQSGSMPAGGVAHGVVYNLPEIHYDIEVRRVLSQCPLPPDKANTNPVGRISFDMTATATARTIAGEEVAIDYSKLADFMKISEFSIERYPSGILKSVNLAVDDRTADVAAEAFKSAVSIAKIAIGLPSGNQAGALDGTKQVNAYIACTDAAYQALEQLPGLRQKVREAESALKTASKAYNDYAADHPEEKPTEAVIAQFSQLRRTRREKQEALDTQTKAVSAAVAKITLVSRFAFVPARGGAEQVNILADAAAEATKPRDVVELRTRENLAGGEKRWLVQPLNTKLELDEDQVERAFFVGSAATAPQSEREGAIGLARDLWTDDNRSRRDEFILLLTELSAAELRIASGAPKFAARATQIEGARACGGTNAPKCGILYRSKAPGLLRACKRDEVGLPSAAACLDMASGDPRVILSDERAIPQLGALASLGFSNGPFSNNTLTAEFADDGTLIKFGYTKPRAEAVAIGQTLNAGLDAASTIITYANGKELRDLGEEKALNDARAALITSAVPLQQPSEVTQVQNQTKLLEEQRKKIEAEIDLRKKQAELDALIAGEEEPNRD